MRPLRPFPALATLALASLALFAAAPALAQDPPTAPCAASTNDFWDETKITLTSTTDSIAVAHTVNSFIANTYQLCKTGSSSINQSSAAINSRSHTFTGLDADTQYWVRISSPSFGTSQWVAIRTESTGPTITISGGSAVTEGTAATFTVNASPAPTAEITVNLTVSESANGDYVASGDEGNKTVTIAANATSATYSVTTQDDSTDEPNGSVTVAVSSGTGYTVGTTSSASVTVNDNDMASPSVPMGCGAAGTQAVSGLFTVRATNRDIIMTLAADLDGFDIIAAEMYLCSPDSGGNYSAASQGTLWHTAIPGGEIWATGLTPGTDYWVKLTRNYLGEHSQWHKVRTSSGSVFLTLNSAGADNTYHNGDAITITAAFGAPVTVTGTPRIPFTIGTTVRYANYLQPRGGGRALDFTYTVQAADRDADGITVAADALELNGGTINFTTGGAAAALDHDAVPASTSHKVAGSSGPTITIAGGSAVTEGTAAEFTVTASEAPTTNLTVNLSVSESATGDYVASADEGAKTVTFIFPRTVNYFITMIYINRYTSVPSSHPTS